MAHSEICHFSPPFILSYPQLLCFPPCSHHMPICNQYHSFLVYPFFISLCTNDIFMYIFLSTFLHEEYHPIAILLHFALFFFFFFGHTCGMWKFLGQGSNLHHSSDSSHCNDNPRSNFIFFQMTN